MRKLSLAALAAFGIASVFAAPAVKFNLNGTDYSCGASGAVTVTCSGTGSSVDPIIASLSGSGVSASVDIAFSDGPGVTFMDLDNSTTTMTGGNTLKMLFTDTGFTTPGSLDLGFGGTINKSAISALQADAYFDTGNNPFSTANHVGTVGPFTAVGNFGGSASGNGPGSQPFSLTEIITFTTGRNTAGFSGDFSLTGTPEPTSVLLLGTLAGLVALAFRKKFAGTQA